MSTYWKHRTNTGEVKYDRRPKDFEHADLRRIARKIASRAEVSTDFVDFGITILYLAWVIGLRAIEKRLDRFIRLFGSVVRALAFDREITDSGDVTVTEAVNLFGPERSA